MNHRSFAGVAFFILFVNILFQPVAAASDDFQYWSRYTLKTFSNEQFEISTYGDIRLFEDASTDGLYLVSERLKYRWFRHLDLGINYTYLEQRVKDAKTGTEEFKYHHRAELEVNPHWDIGDWLKINTRNRLEFRWIEDKGSDNIRLRHLVELEFPIKGREPIKSFYLNNEFFYDFQEGQYTQNRAIPIGIKFKINEKVSFQVFYMIQSQKGASDWSSNQVVGTHLVVSF